MWTWLSRVFRSSSAAERAEAEGRIEDAARLYIENGDRAQAVVVYLRAAETARTLEERREFFTRAYGLARTDEHRDAVSCELHATGRHGASRPRIHRAAGRGVSGGH